MLYYYVGTEDGVHGQERSGGHLAGLDTFLKILQREHDQKQAKKKKGSAVRRRHPPEERNDQDSLVEQDREKVENEEGQLQVTHLARHVAEVEKDVAPPPTVRCPAGALGCRGKEVVKGDGQDGGP